MKLYLKGEPTIEPREGFEIWKGSLHRGGMKSKTIFERDFHIDENSPDKHGVVSQKCFDEYSLTKKKKPDETEKDFQNRITQNLNLNVWKNQPDRDTGWSGSWKHEWGF